MTAGLAWELEGFDSSVWLELLLLALGLAVQLGSCDYLVCLPWFSACWIPDLVVLGAGLVASSRLAMRTACADSKQFYQSASYPLYLGLQVVVLVGVQARLVLAWKRSN